MANFCSNCGKAIEGMKYCPHCGTKAGKGRPSRLKEWNRIEWIKPNEFLKQGKYYLFAGLSIIYFLLLFADWFEFNIPFYGTMMFSCIGFLFKILDLATEFGAEGNGGLIVCGIVTFILACSTGVSTICTCIQLKKSRETVSYFYVTSWISLVSSVWAIVFMYFYRRSMIDEMGVIDSMAGDIVRTTGVVYLVMALSIISILVVKFMDRISGNYVKYYPPKPFNHTAEEGEKANNAQITKEIYESNGW